MDRRKKPINFKYENIYLGIHIGDKAIIDMSLVPHGVRECYCHFEKQASS